MITVYRVEPDGLKSIAVINEEEATVTGSSAMANHLRERIKTIDEDYNLDPSDPRVMDAIRSKLEQLYNNGYIEIR